MTAPIAGIPGAPRAATKPAAGATDAPDPNVFGLALGLAIAAQPVVPPVLSIAPATANGTPDGEAASHDTPCEAPANANPGVAVDPHAVHTERPGLALEIAHALRADLENGRLASGENHESNAAHGAHEPSDEIETGAPNLKDARPAQPTPMARAAPAAVAAALAAASAASTPRLDTAGADRATARLAVTAATARAASVAPAGLPTTGGKSADSGGDRPRADVPTARVSRRATDEPAAPPPALPRESDAAPNATRAISEQSHRVELEASVSRTTASALPRDLGEALDAAAAAPRRALDQVTLPFEGENGLEGRLRIALRGDALHATIVTPDSNAAARIEGALGELHRALLERGFAEVKLAVQHSPASAAAETQKGRSDSRFTEPEHGREERAARDEERARSSHQQSRRGPRQGRQEG